MCPRLGAVKGRSLRAAPRTLAGWFVPCSDCAAARHGSSPTRSHGSQISRRPRGATVCSVRLLVSPARHGSGRHQPGPPTPDVETRHVRRTGLTLHERADTASCPRPRKAHRKGLKYSVTLPLGLLPSRGEAGWKRSVREACSQRQPSPSRRRDSERPKPGQLPVPSHLADRRSRTENEP